MKLKSNASITHINALKLWEQNATLDSPYYRNNMLYLKMKKDIYYKALTFGYVLFLWEETWRQQD